MKNIIARNEFRQTLRDRRFVVAGGVVLVLLLVATATGFGNYRSLADKREQANQTARAAWLGQPEKNPHSAAHYGTFAFRPKSNLSFLDFGLDTYTGASVYLEGHRQNDAKFSQAEDATVLIRFGEMTVAFVLQLLIPLLIIFLCFSTFTREREDNTLKLLVSQGATIPDLYWGKVLGFSRIVALVVGPALLLAGGLLFAQTGFEAGADTVLRLALFVGIYALYFFLFVAGSVFVSARSQSSRGSLLTLLGIWMVACVLLPKATANLGESLFSVPSNFAFKRQIHEDGEKGIDGHNPSNARAKELEKKILAQYKVDSVSQLPINFDGIVMQEGEKYTSMVYQKHFGALQSQFQKQNSLATVVGFVNPYLAVRNLSMGLSGSDYAHFLDFKAEAEQYRFGLVENLNNEMKTFSKTGDWDKKVIRDFWAKTPDFTYQLPSVGWALGQHGLSLLALLVFSGGLLWAVRPGLKRVTIN
jgi:ABC-2 type transport system permease protein